MYFCVDVVYCAVYSMSPVTGDSAGVQPLNVYLYCASSDLDGSSPLYDGVVPYATFVSVSSTVPSKSFHVTVYAVGAVCSHTAYRVTSAFDVYSAPATYVASLAVSDVAQPRNS